MTAAGTRIHPSGSGAYAGGGHNGKGVAGFDVIMVESKWHKLYVERWW